MTKVIGFASLALFTLIALTGCHEIRKCKVGEDGCIGEAPDNGDCAAGLELKNGKCVEPAGGDGPSGPCNCAIDEVCAPDGKTCLAYCAPVDELPLARPTPGSCEPVPTASMPNPPDLTFRELCTATCLQTCVRAETFCPGYTCNPADCERPDALARCLVECPGMDTSCMEDRCFAQSAVACADFRCPGAATRNCQDVRCSDTCPGENTDDGFCDDGDPFSATYSFCPYGTDCTDCGPRRGSRPARLALGEPCPQGQDVACDGYNDDFLKTQAWCLRYLPESDAPFRCVPDCTTEDGAGQCDDGYECQAVLGSGDEPYRDATPNRTAGYACVPVICE